MKTFRSSQVSRILSEGVILSFGNLLSRVVFFGMTIFLTRIFLPEEYGHYVLVKTAILFGAILDTWLIESVMRFYAEYARKGAAALFQSRVRTVAAWHVCITVVVIAGMLMLLPVEPAIRQLLFIVVAVYVLDYLYRLNLQILRARRDARAHCLMSIVYAVLRLVLALALIFEWSRSIESVLVAWIVADVALLPFLIHRANRGVKATKGGVQADGTMTTPPLRELFRYGAPFILLSASWMGLYMADRFMLQWLQDASQVGLYGLACSFAELGYIIPFMLVASPAQAATMEAWSKGSEKEASDCLTRLVRHHLLIALPLIAALATLAQPIVMTFTQEAYFPAAAALSLLAPGLLGWGLLAFSNLSFMLKKQTALLATLGIAGLTMNIVLNGLLIPRFGFLGAAAATSVTYTALAAGGWFLAGKYLHLVPRILWPSALRALFASAIMVVTTQIAVWVLPVGLPSLLAIGFVGTLAYCLTLSAMGESQISTGLREIGGMILGRGQTI